MEIAKRVVSIGAHSLDAELLGGPLILKYAKQGSHCTLVHVTHLLNNARIIFQNLCR